MAGSLALLFLCDGTAFAAASGTASAVPDFSGVWTRAWKVRGSFDAPPTGPGPIMLDPAHPRVPRFFSEGGPDTNRPTDPWAADLSNPILKAETRAKLKVITDAELAGHPHLEMQSMCRPPGVPGILNLRDSMTIAQTPNEVLILYSRDHQTRHIYLNVPHSKNPGHTWFGESVGHYEGSTLVVDTIGENDKSQTDRFGTPHSDAIHVIERYTPSGDGKRIDVLFTVDDPGAFTMPWSARADYVPADVPFEENVCAENNRPTGPGFDIPIPLATKADF